MSTFSSLSIRSVSSSHNASTRGTTPRRVLRDVHAYTLCSSRLFSSSCARQLVRRNFIICGQSCSKLSSASIPPALSSCTSFASCPHTIFHTASTAVRDMGSVRVFSSTLHSRLSTNNSTPCSSPTTCWFGGQSLHNFDMTVSADWRMPNGCNERSLSSDNIIAHARPPSSSWYPGRAAVCVSTTRHAARRLSSDCSARNSRRICTPSISRNRSGQLGTRTASTSRHWTWSWRACWREYLQRATC
mmetsp:Transcript_18074/g.28883  ORF Transcript_18074/g.28883 Transcript_18074/m.28883 type:complete len:245 (-) Transcript_18074:350-1084(-)